jgi:hypothetical protein
MVVHRRAPSPHSADSRSQLKKWQFWASLSPIPANRAGDRLQQAPKLHPPWARIGISQAKARAVTGIGALGHLCRFGGGRGCECNGDVTPTTKQVTFSATLRIAANRC